MGNARHARHLNAVTPIRAARNQFAQPDDGVALLLHGHAVVLHGREVFRQFVEVVVVRGEQRFAADTRQMFCDRPRDGKAIVGAGPAPDLVQHDQAALGGVIEDAGRLVHFDHKR